MGFGNRTGMHLLKGSGNRRGWKWKGTCLHLKHGPQGRIENSIYEKNFHEKYLC